MSTHGVPTGTLFGSHLDHAMKTRKPEPSPAVRSDAPKTSRDAAKRAGASSKANRVRILGLMKTRGQLGLTCYEAQEALGIKPQSASARFTELKKNGYIQATGEARPTDTGSNAAAWRITEDGLAHYRGACG